MFGPIVAVAWIAGLSAFVYAWMRFAARRHKLVAQILDDRQRRIDNELTDNNPDATKFVAVGVRLSELRPITGGTAKCKAPRVVRACVQVDEAGRVVEAVKP